MTAQILEFPKRTDRVEVDASALPLACADCHHMNFKILFYLEGSYVQCQRCGLEQEL